MKTVQISKYGKFTPFGIWYFTQTDLQRMLNDQAKMTEDEERRRYTQIVSTGKCDYCEKYKTPVKSYFTFKDTASLNNGPDIPVTGHLELSGPIEYPYLPDVNVTPLEQKARWDRYYKIFDKLYYYA